MSVDEIVSDSTITGSIKLSPPPANINLFDDWSNIYIRWCWYGIGCLVMLWTLIIISWYYYRGVINDLIVGDSNGNHSQSCTSIEGLQYPLITSSSDVHLHTLLYGSVYITNHIHSAQNIWHKFLITMASCKYLCIINLFAKYQNCKA
jgi:hypothetical protein